MENGERNKTLMQEAVNLAKKSFNQTLPNPRVGAVLFNETGRVIGRGYHKAFGSPHAEVEAIADAKSSGFDTTGASLCVTLEPCNHTGKTPPCTQAIVNSGIRKVFVGTRDDCRGVAGCGFETLEKNNIDVKYGILEEECRDLNPGFHKYNDVELPFVHLKIAMSLNGKMTNRLSKGAKAPSWFTGEKSRQRVHEYRAFSDLVITGVGTIEKDNPRFNSRLSDLTLPNRIAILDAELKLFNRYKSRDLNIFKEGNDVTVITSDAKRGEELKRDGVKIIEAECDKNGFIVLPKLIKNLGKNHGYREIFIEAGALVSTSALKLDKKYLDRITLFIAPVWFNKDEKSLFADSEELFPNIDIISIEQLENTLCVQGRP